MKELPKKDLLKETIIQNISHTRIATILKEEDINKLNKNELITKYIEKYENSEILGMWCHLIEVALRNKINQFFITNINEEWLDMIIKKEKIFKSYDLLSHDFIKAKEQSKTKTNDDIISKTYFATWCYILESTYNDIFYNKNGFSFVFGIEIKNKKEIEKTKKYIHNIRKKIRNRIFHYEIVIINDNIKEELDYIFEKLWKEKYENLIPKKYWLENLLTRK